MPNATFSPTAPSVGWYRRELLKSNRILGLPHGVLSALLSLAIAGGAHFGGFYSLSVWWELPLGWALVWWGVELCFLRRRLTIHRMAIDMSRNEVARQAIKHGVGLSDVLVTDDPATPYR